MGPGDWPVIKDSNNCWLNTKLGMDLISVTESVCEYAELGKMSMDENRE